jgi:hypothetical protein
MANIFEKTDQVVGGAFTAENCTLNLGKGIEGAIVQRVQFNIERPINFVYEIGQTVGQPQKVYYVGGRRRGQATFERIVGGSATFSAFVDTYGPLCDKAGEDITLTATGQCKIDGGAGNPSQTTKYILKTPKITGLGASVSAQDIVIVENVQMAFLDLQYDKAAA